ncbi:unnamed protein product [Sphenostylis stenocarpa]|uniref:Uncharacterized protein n=1 Tax=Sphenostylis stenocarpa TaxID=92480 RepID=A0AA86SFG6_9FABA|nr:unnamed protein product [Sphenostylis stenocarpa]
MSSHLSVRYIRLVVLPPIPRVNTPDLFQKGSSLLDSGIAPLDAIAKLRGAEGQTSKPSLRPTKKAKASSGATAMSTPNPDIPLLINVSKEFSDGQTQRQQRPTNVEVPSPLIIVTKMLQSSNTSSRITSILSSEIIGESTAAAKSTIFLISRQSQI